MYTKVMSVSSLFGAFLDVSWDCSWADDVGHGNPSALPVEPRNKCRLSRLSARF